MKKKKKKPDKTHKRTKIYSKHNVLKNAGTVTDRGEKGWSGRKEKD